jgi:hypothetical protein
MLNKIGERGIMRKPMFDIGLTYYQECQWISAIKNYGEVIMEKSLLSRDQKDVLIEEAKKEMELLRDVRK